MGLIGSHLAPPIRRGMRERQYHATTSTVDPSRRESSLTRHNLVWNLVKVVGPIQSQIVPGTYYLVVTAFGPILALVFCRLGV
jgi:hypothetical protein